jgi:secreted trypsin-like serine protease
LSSNQHISPPRRRLIIHGHKAIPGRYPYFSQIDDYCGGSLIAPDIVLAAGHCQPLKSWYLPQVRVGVYDVHHLQDELVQPAYFVRHPTWRERGDDDYVNDFLLIKLQNATSIHRPYLRINANPNLPYNHQPVTAMGMGNTDPDCDECRSSTLREVSLNAITNEQCSLSQSEERDMTYHDRISSSHLCTTGGPHNERDAWYVHHSMLTCF